MNTSIINELRDSINPSSTNLSQACRDIWIFISSQTEEKRPEYLKTFLTDFRSEKDFLKDPPEDFDKLEWGDQQNEEELTDLEKRIVSNLIDSNIEESAFYSELCTKLGDDTLLSSIEDKAIFLALLWEDPQIPYYQLEEGRVMDNKQYGTIISKIRDPLDKAFFILNAKLHYKTQRSSLLIKVANTLENEDERIVFWAVLLDVQNKQIQELYKALDELKHGGKQSDGEESC